MTCSTVHVSVSGPVGPTRPDTRVMAGLRAAISSMEWMFNSSATSQKM